MDISKTEDLFKICSSGSIKSIRKIFDNWSKMEIESLKDIQNASCLHYAARTGFIDALEYFIFQKNITPYLSSKVGATIIHDAAVKGHIDTIKWILHNTSLNISLKDSDGATVIHLASKFDRVNLIEWLIEHHSTDVFREQTYNGASCLHFACASNSFKTLAKLTTFFPSLINIQMMNGVTPFYLAVQENNYPVVKFLLKMGANINLRATDGMAPLHVACSNNNLVIAKYILEQNVSNVNDNTLNGSNPLHFASSKNSVDLVSYLFASGAKILPNKNGNTPLHECAIQGNIEVARLLIANGCEVSFKNNDRKTCIDVAKANSQIEFVKEFKSFLDKDQKSLFDTKNTHLVTSTSVKESESILSPLNSLISLKKIPTSTPQDFLTIISDSTDHPKINEKEKNEKQQRPSITLNRNQSLVKIVRKDETNNYKSDKSDHTPQSQYCGKYVKRNESVQSTTLAELNNCIAKFEKFSYFTDENLTNEKEIKLNEISNKLNEIKNCLIESKNKQLNTGEILNSENQFRLNEVEKSISKIHTPPQSESIIYNKPQDGKNSQILSNDISNQVSNSTMPPPPPPPPPFSALFSKKENTKEDLKEKILQIVERKKTLQAVKSDSNMATLKSSKNVSSMRTTNSCNNFMTELQTKIQRSRDAKINNFVSEENDPIRDMNNNSSYYDSSDSSYDHSDKFSSNDDKYNTNKTRLISTAPFKVNPNEIKQISIQRLQNEMPEWKRILIEKKRNKI